MIFSNFWDAVIIHEVMLRFNGNCSQMTSNFERKESLKVCNVAGTANLLADAICERCLVIYAL
jgi:hypothetical protein